MQMQETCTNVLSYALHSKNNIYYEDIFQGNPARKIAVDVAVAHLSSGSAQLQTIVSKRFEESLGGVSRKNVIIGLSDFGVRHCCLWS